MLSAEHRLVEVVTAHGATIHLLDVRYGARTLCGRRAVDRADMDDWRALCGTCEQYRTLGVRAADS